MNGDSTEDLREAVRAMASSLQATIAARGPLGDEVWELAIQRERRAGRARLARDLREVKDGLRVLVEVRARGDYLTGRVRKLDPVFAANKLPLARTLDALVACRRAVEALRKGELDAARRELVAVREGCAPETRAAADADLIGGETPSCNGS